MYYKNGLHFSEDNFIAEIINPATGKKEKDKKAVSLSLLPSPKKGMPIIRYRTRDLSFLDKRHVPAGVPMQGWQNPWAGQMICSSSGASIYSLLRSKKCL
jgi:phenylacetate-coenzyme A ligase PaaK-like adenylate-forming protein